MLSYCAGVCFIVIFWYAVNLVGIAVVINRVLPREYEWARQFVALVTLTAASYRVASAGRGWREQAGWIGVANAGMMQGLLAALIVTVSSRTLEEELIYKVPSIGFGFPWALLLIAYRTIGEVFGPWEFVELALASGAGMLGAMKTARINGPEKLVSPPG